MKLFRLSLWSIALWASACWLPWSAATAADDAPANENRFTPLPGFQVQEVVTPGSTGSLVAMTFNETGDIIASRERGPLLLIQDKDHDGTFESISTFCDKVDNCQGILVLEDHVFAVGNGPSAAAFYRLTDADGDGKAEKVETLFKFKGGMGEHGPHAPLLGPDGLIYIMIGNHAFVAGPVAATSPHHHYYDAELITPKYEDANGHAAGIKAPGGAVVRTDTNGSFLELFVGGFRNAYDHAFNRDGELFTFDSDMEWDVGLPWYRPTRVNHLIPGAEFGWRSGWSTWPNYFVDSLPTTIDIGRGSPTGVEFYDHHRFPRKYQGAFFMCDWSQGRILAVTLEHADGSYRAQSEIFLEGRPLNCSDIGVGPDGWLYFCVGGRNTEGSIFRIVADEKTQQPAAPVTRGVAQALAQPQLSSAWARRAVREAQQEAGAQWGPGLVAVAVNTQAPAHDRTRALDLMQLFSPPPANALLLQLSQDAEADVRAKAAYLLGIHATPDSNARLVALLDDADATVRRRACEALVRARHPGPVEKLCKVMAEPRPFVAWAARRALEQLPTEQWQSTVLASSNPRVFIMGSVALATLDADRDTAGAILTEAGKWLDKHPSDDNLLDLLRVIELALHRGQFTGQEQAALRSRISAFYPASDYRVNRELARTLVMLQDLTLAPRLIQHLQGRAPMEERIQAAMLARFLNVGWTPELRGELLDFYALAGALEGGNSYRGYLANAANDVLKTMPPAEQLARIQAGAKSPAAALGVVQHLTSHLTAEQAAALRSLDTQLAGDKSAPARELAKAVLVALAHGDDSALAYLHEVFESAPDRRQDVAQALSRLALTRAQREVDWPLLVRSLSVVEGSTARDVLRALAKFPQQDDKAQDQRQVILLGLKLGDQGGREAAALLTLWTGQKVAEPGDPWPAALAAWQKWFVEKYPDQPEPVPSVEPTDNKYTMSQLVDFLSSDEAAHGNLERGAAVFEKAQCVKCHRYGLHGEGIGPDLSNVSSRFQRKEIVESVIFPSQVISDQFAAKTVVTTDGRTYTGLVGPTGDGVVVLQASAEKVNVAKPDIDSIVPSKKSAMPEGLFNTLTLAEIADLFAYMNKPPVAK
jgi:putative heme-binding domain-containing protein